jgi:hypothetical protein
MGAPQISPISTFFIHYMRRFSRESRLRSGRPSAMEAGHNGKLRRRMNSGVPGWEVGKAEFGEWIGCMGRLV